MVRFTGRVVKSVSLPIELVRAIECLKIPAVSSFSALVEYALRQFIGLSDDREYFLVVVNLDNDAYQIVMEYRKSVSSVTNQITISEAIVDLIKQRKNFQKMSRLYQDRLFKIQRALEEVLGVDPDVLIDAHEKGDDALLDDLRSISVRIRNL